MTQPGSDQRLTVPAPGGRVLEVLTSGPEDGLALVFHTGTPSGLVFADHLAASFRAALSTGIDGWRDDDLAFSRDWGISLEALGHATPVAVWQGDQDRMVPPAHGAWLAANTPRARARLRPGEGHHTLVVNGFGGILDDLLALAGRRRPGSAM